VAKLPVHPRLATAIVRADSREKLAAAVISASFLDDDTGGGRSATDADFVTRMRTLLESPKNSFSVNSVLQCAARISDEARDAVLFLD
jgi:HrpA-like RNA helicase